ncbi:hypothetical protein ACCO45_007282 [Purpureocillium lilacinum]|uniref:Uncharacterized protein n=1 Tax=Purpureocillium lilacinum TaxID=33203 RepID=A0ACC4DUY0_PURLI
MAAPKLPSTSRMALRVRAGQCHFTGVCQPSPVSLPPPQRCSPDCVCCLAFEALPCSQWPRNPLSKLAPVRPHDHEAVDQQVQAVPIRKLARPSSGARHVPWPRRLAREVLAVCSTRQDTRLPPA